MTTMVGGGILLMFGLAFWAVFRAGRRKESERQARQTLNEIELAADIRRSVDRSGDVDERLQEWRRD